MNIIDKSIIQKVKDYLNNKTDNVWELYLHLRNRRNGLHPDRYTDEDAKKRAEDDFKKANSLLSELEAFIQQQNAANVPILREENNEMTEFFHLKTVDAKDEEIKDLRIRIQLLEHDLKTEKRLNEDLLLKIEDLSKGKVDDIHDEIISIYTPRKALKNIGLIAILTSLLVTFPVVSDFMEKIGADSKVIMLALQVVSVVTLFNWARSWLVNKIVENVEYQILNSSNLNEILNVRETETGYSKKYLFYEADITSHIRKQFKPLHRLVLFGGIDKTFKILTDDVILQLDRKKLIKNSGAEGLMKYFEVNKPNDSADFVQ